MTIREYLKVVLQGVKTYVDNGLAGKANTSHGTHVSWSTTTPKANGTASVGSETKVARGDHVHPLQTTISGNAGSATKLETARTIRTNLGSTSTASFDGSANVTPGVTGTLPIANGGTGLTSNPRMLTNLGTTSAADVLAASPRPGVTGVLPIANGGTGAIGAASALINLGLTATATELNYCDGVTSNIQTQLNGKAASSHNHSASNITSGTLPVERGGTGATTATDALTNLGALGNSGDQEITNGSLQITSTENEGIRIDKVIDDSNFNRLYALLGDDNSRFGFSQNGSVVNQIKFTSTETTLSKPLTIASGGTGATTAKAAATNLGIASPNLLINGDFQVWQRGTSFTDIANCYTADRWLIKNAKGNTSEVKRSTSVPSGKGLRYSMLIRETLTENTYLRYMLEHAIKGTYTLSFWYKGTVDFNSYIYDNEAWVHLGKNATSSSWKRVSYTFTATSVTQLGIIHAISAGTCYIAGVKLERSSVMTEFSPKPYQEELDACQRYYNFGAYQGVFTYHDSTDGYMCEVTLPQVRIAKPTITIPQAIFYATSGVKTVQNPATSWWRTSSASYKSNVLYVYINSGTRADYCFGATVTVYQDAEIYP